MIHTGDCVEVMAGMPADSVDAVVTDPPYGLEFMGKEWDRFDRNGPASFVTTESSPSAYVHDGKPAVDGKVRGKVGAPKKSPYADRPRWGTMGDQAIRRFQAWCEAWGREALRVTKPGGYLLAFGGTRTHHRLVCGLEDAGWIIRDELDWIYASGFPKGKANLKPAHEPIVLARKPGPLRPLNIEETRIPGGGTSGWSEAPGRKSSGGILNITDEVREAKPDNPAGRWPSNLLLSDPELFDEPNPWVVGSGATDAGGGFGRAGGNVAHAAFDGGMHNRGNEFGYGDAGGYSRFFAIPRYSDGNRQNPSPGEAGAGGSDPASQALPVRGDNAREGRESPETGGERGRDYPSAFLIPKSSRSDREPIITPDGHDRSKRFSTHPTQKPTDLMRHLIRLVTPPGGTVLDPFLGSGSTAIAAELEGFPWIGIEKEPEYVAIAEARLNGTQRGLGLDVPAPTQRRTTKPLEQRSSKEQARLRKSNAERPIEDLYWTMKGRKDGEEPAA